MRWSISGSTDGSGLDVVPQILQEARGSPGAVMLTGYGNIATAVTAIKAGAVDYLPKPADADQVEAALLATARTRAGRRRRSRCPPTACAGSTSSGSTSNATATSPRRRAGCNMHRRTLQRILAKYAPKG